MAMYPLKWVKMILKNGEAFKLQWEKAATAESNAASKRAPSASRQYMSYKKNHKLLWPNK